MKQKNNLDISKELNLCYVYYKLTKTDELLKKEFSKFFSINSVKIDDLALLVDKEKVLVKSKGLDISLFDAVFFRIPKFAYSKIVPIIKHLPENIILPQGKNFEVVSSKLSLYEKLARNELRIPKMIFAEGVETAINNLKYLDFPILLRVPTDKKKVMLANSILEAKSMMDALKVLKQPVYLEEYYPEAELISLYVIGDEVVASTKIKPFDVEYQGEQKQCKAEREFVSLALKVAKILETKIAKVDIAKFRNEKIIIDVDLSPYLDSVRNVSEKICNLFLSEVEEKKEPEIVKKLTETIKNVIKI